MSHVILKIGGTILLGCLGAYVVNEVRKEYDDCVDENNSLRDFIRDHDFYEKQEPATQVCTASNQNSGKPEYQASLAKIDEYVNEQGKTVGVYKDLKSGFTVSKVEGAPSRCVSNLN